MEWKCVEKLDSKGKQRLLQRRNHLPIGALVMLRMCQNLGQNDPWQVNKPEMDIELKTLGHFLNTLGISWTPTLLLVRMLYKDIY